MTDKEQIAMLRERLQAIVHDGFLSDTENHRAQMALAAVATSAQGQEKVDERAEFEKALSNLNYMQTFSHVFGFVEAPTSTPPQRKFLDWSTEMAWIGWRVGRAVLKTT